MALLIQWSDNLSVGVAEIDEQHMKLVGLINKLHNAMSLGQGKEIMGQIINEMVNYTIEHFGTEEKYFARFGFEKAAEHIREHKNFVEKALDLQTKFNKGEVGITIGTLKFLQEWLTNHIQGSDKEYTKCFNSNGLA